MHGMQRASQCSLKRGGMAKNLIVQPSRLRMLVKRIDGGEYCGMPVEARRLDDQHRHRAETQQLPIREPQPQRRDVSAGSAFGEDEVRSGASCATDDGFVSGKIPFGDGSRLHAMLTHTRGNGFQTIYCPRLQRTPEAAKTLGAGSIDVERRAQAVEQLDLRPQCPSQLCGLADGGQGNSLRIFDRDQNAANVAHSELPIGGRCFARR